MPKSPANKSDIKENIVVKSNELIAASYAMTVNEQRLLLACISQIDSRKRLESDAVFSLTVEEARDLFYHKGDQRNAYRDLQDAAERLFERKVRIDLSGNEELLTRFVQSVRFKHDSNVVELRFATEVLPYLSHLEQNFTKYRLANVVQLTSFYAIRIYELIVSWTGQGLSFKEMEIKDFRELLGAEEKYKLFGEFKRRVIDPSLTQINESTDLELDITFRKNRRKFNWIQLRFNRKAEAVRMDAAAKKERIERQQHNTVMKEKRVEAEQQATKELADKAQKAAVDAYFAQVPRNSLFVGDDGRQWEFDGEVWLNGVGNRTAVRIDTAYSLIQSGEMRLMGGGDQADRESLEARGQGRLIE